MRREHVTVLFVFFVLLIFDAEGGFLDSDEFVNPDALNVIGANQGGS